MYKIVCTFVLPNGLTTVVTKAVSTEEKLVAVELFFEHIKKQYGATSYDIIEIVHVTDTDEEVIYDKIH